MPLLHFASQRLSAYFCEATLCRSGSGGSFSRRFTEMNSKHEFARWVGRLYRAKCSVISWQSFCLLSLFFYRIVEASCAAARNFRVFSTHRRSVFLLKIEPQPRRDSSSALCFPVPLLVVLLSYWGLCFSARRMFARPRFKLRTSGLSKVDILSSIDTAPITWTKFLSTWCLLWRGFPGREHQMVVSMMRLIVVSVTDNLREIGRRVCDLLEGLRILFCVVIYCSLRSRSVDWTCHMTWFSSAIEIKFQ